ncbi:Protein of unknown function DUF1676 [Cinara cedri]|uniref:Uncharacterized protein n=1 Tax=Cinara cedri TaxID=506608 RepID=A0A5E4MMN0_9HEMI|nr:Protein of unknown function DUF1676 [Cinara cedri]
MMTRRSTSALCVLFLYATGDRLLRPAAAADQRAGSAPQESSPVASRCANNYTMTCVKRDVLALLDALDGERSYEIYPGITIYQRRSPAPSRNESLDAANSTRLDYLIAKRLDGYADSVDLRVRLLDPINATAARSVGHTVLERLLPFLRMSMTKRIMLLVTVKSLHYLLPKLWDRLSRH